MLPRWTCSTPSLGTPDHTAKGPSGALLSCVSEVPGSRTALSNTADAVAMPKRIAINRENPAGGPGHGRFNATSLALVGWSLKPGTRSSHRPDQNDGSVQARPKFASLSTGVLAPRLRQPSIALCTEPHRDAGVLP